MSKKNLNKDIEFPDEKKDILEQAINEPEVESEVEPIEEIPEEKIIGVVTDCGKLRFRKEPSTDAIVFTELENGNVVTLTSIEKVNGFYPAELSDGLRGYVMAKFIAVR